MKKPTAAPWTAARNSSNGWIRISGPDGQAVANVKTWANAQLITATPDILAALVAIVESLSLNDEEGMIEYAEQMIDARAAIAKATGVQS